MKKKIRRIQLNRETIRQLDPPTLGWAAGGGTAGTVCCTGITETRPTIAQTCGGGGTIGPKQQ
ncbi:MAG TPA: hypothetical protein VFE33_05190 [Thermoanaerobaculia bacterium]|nr:hypothetical protein [Thermoanaerobaculia bacterium]